MSDQNWRTDVDAGDYFLHQKKQLQIADRRPVIRRASDIVGPGIGEAAYRLTDLNDPIALFNGYYSTAAGAGGAPTPDEPFIGYVVSDATLAGVQVFTGLISGTEYRRTFTRDAVSPDVILWGVWSGGDRVPATCEAPVGLYTPIPAAAGVVGAYAVNAPTTLNLWGPENYYERTPSTITILEHGIYTGVVRLHVASPGIAVQELQFSVPDGLGGVSHQVVVPGAAIDGVTSFAFTCRALGGEGFGVAVRHSLTNPQNFAWSLSCTRTGDAV